MTEYINKEYYSQIPTNERHYIKLSQRAAYAAVDALEAAGIPHSATISEYRSTVTVNKADSERAEKIVQEYANAYPAERKIIGNVEYKEIRDRKYINTDADTAWKISAILSGTTNIRFSGIVTGDKATITVSGEKNAAAVRSMIDNYSNLDLLEELRKRGYERTADTNGFVNIRNVQTGEVCGFGSMSAVRDMFENPDNEFFHPLSYRIAYRENPQNGDYFYYIQKYNPGDRLSAHAYRNEENKPYLFKSADEALALMREKGIEITNSGEQIDGWRTAEQEREAKAIIEENKKLAEKFPVNHGAYLDLLRYYDKEDVFSWLYFDPDGDNGNGEFVDKTITKEDIFAAYSARMSAETEQQGRDKFIAYLNENCRETKVEMYSGYFADYASEYINYMARNCPYYFGISENNPATSMIDSFIDTLELNCEEVVRDKEKHAEPLTIDAYSKGLELDGYPGKWDVRETVEMDGEELFLLDSNSDDDEVPRLIADKDGNIRASDVWGDISDYMEIWKIKRLIEDAKNAADGTPMSIWGDIAADMWEYGYAFNENNETYTADKNDVLRYAYSEVIAGIFFDISEKYRSEPQELGREYIHDLNRFYSEYDWDTFEPYKNVYDNVIIAASNGVFEPLDAYIAQVRADCAGMPFEESKINEAAGYLAEVKKIYAEISERNSEIAAENAETISADEPENNADLTELQRKAVEIAREYQTLPLQEKISVVARTFGATTGEIITSPCSGKWRGTSDMSIRFNDGRRLFLNNCPTPKAKTKKVRNEFVDSAIAEYNPEIISLAKETAFAALKKREKIDNEIAAQKSLKPYTLLSVEFDDGRKNIDNIGWYYVTIAVDGKIHAHMETGLNYNIRDGKVSETPTRENYFVAGALNATDVDYVFNNVGYSTTAGLYTLTISDEVRERAEKVLAGELENSTEENISSTDDSFAIYQVKSGEAYHYMRFASYGELNGEPNADNYDLVYSGSLSEMGLAADSADQTLENIFSRFNVDRPGDFKGHSLSTSDVVEIGGKAYYVNDIGFVNLPEFHLSLEKQEEMTVPQNSAPAGYMSTIEIDKYDEPINGMSKQIGTKTYGEVFAELEQRLKSEGFMPDEYFKLSFGVNEDEPVPENWKEFNCITNFGGSEGIYLDITLVTADKTYPFATGKTLGETVDDFVRMSRIGAECSMLLNGNGSRISLGRSQEENIETERQFPNGERSAEPAATVTENETPTVEITETVDEPSVTENDEPEEDTTSDNSGDTVSEKETPAESTEQEEPSAVPKAAVYAAAKSAGKNSLAHRAFVSLKERFPDFMARKHSYEHDESDGFEPLSLEWIAADQISIMQTYKQNGDLMYDPDIVMLVDLENETANSLSFENSGLGFYQHYENDPQGQRDTNNFVLKWMETLQHQRHKLTKANVEYPYNNDVFDITVRYSDGKIIGIDGDDEAVADYIQRNGITVETPAEPEETGYKIKPENIVASSAYKLEPQMYIIIDNDYHAENTQLARIHGTQGNRTIEYLRDDLPEEIKRHIEKLADMLPNRIDPPTPAEPRSGEPMVTIGFSEHPDVPKNITLPFSQANEYLGQLDMQQHNTRDDEIIGDGYYHKTDFTIKFVINGQENEYNGRYDLGDGEGSLLDHIANEFNYSKKNQKAYGISDEEMAEREEFLAYLYKYANVGIYADNPLDKAKQLIDRFSMEEYNAEADFSDLHNVSLAYAVITEKQLLTHVTADLADCKLNYDIDGKIIFSKTYDSIEEMIVKVFAGMNNDTFSAVTDADIDRYAAEKFRAVSREKFNPIYDFEPDEIEKMAKDFITETLEDAGVDAEIGEVVLYGSRSRGLENANSDIDIVVQIKSDLKEYALFNILHDEEMEIEGIPVDINPIRAEETGSLYNYLNAAEEYLESKNPNRVISLSEKEKAVIDIIAEMAQSSRTVLGAYTYSDNQNFKTEIQNAVNTYSTENLLGILENKGFFSDRGISADDYVAFYNDFGSDEKFKTEVYRLVEEAVTDAFSSSQKDLSAEETAVNGVNNRTLEVGDVIKSSDVIFGEAYGVVTDVKDFSGSPALTIKYYSDENLTKGTEISVSVTSMETLNKSGFEYIGKEADIAAEITLDNVNGNSVENKSVLLNGMAYIFSEVKFETGEVYILPDCVSDDNIKETEAYKEILGKYADRNNIDDLDENIRVNIQTYRYGRGEDVIPDESEINYIREHSSEIMSYSEKENSTEFFAQLWENVENVLDNLENKMSEQHKNAPMFTDRYEERTYLYPADYKSEYPYYYDTVTAVKIGGEWLDTTDAVKKMNSQDNTDVSQIEEMRVHTISFDGIVRDEEVAPEVFYVYLERTRAQIENMREAAEIDAKFDGTYLPLYNKGPQQAREDGEREIYFANLRENEKCAASIDYCVACNHDGYYFKSENAIREMLTKYSLERITQIVAATTAQKGEFDKRFSVENYKWAKENVPEEDVLKHIRLCNCHPILLDSVATQLRTQYELYKDIQAEMNKPEISEQGNLVSGIKNLSQLKKALKPGMEFIIADHWRRNLIGNRRLITNVNTAGFSSKVIDEKGNASGEDIYMRWGKAGEWKFDNDTVSAYMNNGKLTMSIKIYDGPAPSLDEDTLENVPEETEENPAEIENASEQLAVEEKRDSDQSIDRIMQGVDNVTESINNAFAESNSPMGNSGYEPHINDIVEYDGTVYAIAGISGNYLSLQETDTLFPNDRTISITDFLNGKYSVIQENGNVVPETEPEEIKMKEIVIDLSPKGGYDRPQTEKKTAEPAPKKGHNFVITDDHYGDMGGAKARYEANAAAIKTLKNIEKEKRFATPEEQEILAKYTGWGAIPQVFDENNTKWSNEFAELQELLTTEEYEAARHSTMNAHYTNPTVISAIYDGLNNLGFSGGKILEPAVGVGNFFGRLPEFMKDSRLYGVELDSVTGRIAQQLYPEAKIQVRGFEDTEFSDNSFDVAIGNVPFGDYKVFDPEYNDKNFNIHDYFIAKSLDKVHPGAIVAFVTSKGTLDKESGKVREYIAQRAELLGAIRLPNNAFKASAGTEVTSDIIFLQKREKSIEIDPDKVEWIKKSEISEGLSVNNYFVQHPEMVLGKIVPGNKLYGNDTNDTSCVAIPGADLKEQLAAAVKNIKGSYKKAEIEIEPEDEKAVPAPENSRKYSYYAVDGELYYREAGMYMKKANLPKDRTNRVMGMVALRENVHELLNLQLENSDGSLDGKIDECRKKLNRSYDNFVRKYGNVSDKKNERAMKGDNGYSIVAALENKDGNGKVTGKADIFRKNTVKPKIIITHVDTAEEALILSLSEKGKIDFGYMTELCGMDKDKLINSLEGQIFKLPQEKEKYVTADEYLSGNIRKKMFDIVNCDDPKAYEGNYNALQAALPPRVEAKDISVKLGSHWVDPSYIRDFILEKLDPDTETRDRLDVQYSNVAGTWKIEGMTGAAKSAHKSINTYGTIRKNAYEIIEEILNNGDLQVRDRKKDEYGNEIKDKNGRYVYVVNAEETKAVKQRATQIQSEFKDWIFKDPERREALVAKYNELYNSFRYREFDGSHLNFVGMNPEITLKDHQKNAVARALYGGNTLLAHAVGAGKTFEMAAIAMEGKRLGLHHKSLVAVPNALTEQIGADFLKLYPNAKILVATPKDFEAKNRKKLLANMAANDWDAVIVGHSQFDRMGLSPEREIKYIMMEVDKLRAELRRINAENPNGKKSFSVKQIEKTISSYMDRLIKLNEGQAKDDFIDFEQLGFDKIFVDESHMYKNLATPTKMHNVAGLGSRGSARAFNLLMKSKYLNELTGEKGCVFSTGTPISNSMTEMYTLMRYLQPGTLKDLNLNHFDEWAADFGEVITDYEYYLLCAI